MGEFSIIFTARDFNKSIEFYRDRLKLPVVQSWDNGSSEKGIVFQAADGLIEILSLKPGTEYVAPAHFELSIGITDVDIFYQFVKRQGLSIYGEIGDKPWGARTFSLLDPDGVKLIFSEPIQGKAS